MSHQTPFPAVRPFHEKAFERAPLQPANLVVDYLSMLSSVDQTWCEMAAHEYDQFLFPGTQKTPTEHAIDKFEQYGGHSDRDYVALEIALHRAVHSVLRGSVLGTAIHDDSIGDITAAGVAAMKGIDRQPHHLIHAQKIELVRSAQDMRMIRDETIQRRAALMLEALPFGWHSISLRLPLVAR